MSRGGGVHIFSGFTEESARLARRSSNKSYGHKSTFKRSLDKEVPLQPILYVIGIILIILFLAIYPVLMFLVILVAISYIVYKVSRPEKLIILRSKVKEGYTLRPYTTLVKRAPSGFQQRPEPRFCGECVSGLLPDSSFCDECGTKAGD